MLTVMDMDLLKEKLDTKETIEKLSRQLEAAKKVAAHRAMLASH